VAVLVAAATIWALQLAKPDNPTNTATSTDPTTTTATSTTTTSSTPEQDLLDLVPNEFPRGQCDSARLAGNGVIASVNCGASTSKPGPTGSTFYLYKGSDELREAFEAEMSAVGLRSLPVGAECIGDAGFATWAVEGDEDRTAGYFACQLIQDESGVAQALIQWTYDEYAFYGQVSMPGGAAELAQLWAWWKDKGAASP